MTEPHAWELRQHEKAQAAAAETVGRLARALAEWETELDYRREALGQIVADRHDRGARVLAAHQAGARMVFGGASGSPSTAEAAWPDVPADAVRVIADHIVQQPLWDAEETTALSAVSDLERRVHQTRRALNHWLAEAGTTDSPADSAPVGPIENGAVEQAEAAAVAVADHGPPAVQSPAAPFSTRLAELGRRVAGW